MTEINELEGKKLDQAVHEMRGMKPRWEAVVYNSDESGIVATTSSAGPWFTPVELREWLEDEQNQGRLLDYHIKTTPTYPPYSRDIAQAWELQELIDAESVRDGKQWWEWPSPKARYIHALCHVCGVEYEAENVAEWYDGWQMTYLGMWMLIHATPEQRCRAYLKAKEGA